MKLVPKDIRNELRLIGLKHADSKITTLTNETKATHFILAQGPRCSDAPFTRDWLSGAIEADHLLRDCFSEDLDFHISVAQLECPYRIEFGMSAMAFVSMWQKQNGCFTLDIIDPEWAEIFCVMVGLGFFRQTGQQYQMVVPNQVEIDRIRNELLRLMATQDSRYRLHPENLLTTMPQTHAIEGKRQLKRMHWEKRVANRDALLAESNLRSA